MIKMLKKLLTILGIALIIFMITGAIYQYVGMKLDERKFSPIGKMVGVGGYKLHMVEQGKDNQGPVIIIEPGLGGNCLSSLLVTPEIAKFARVITYDRAGQGWSDASSLPRTAENIVQELHTMLVNADVSGPYILVGHSFGGIIVRLFAADYPEDVAGVILLDASHENAFDDEKLSAQSTRFKLWELYERCRWYFCHYFGIERYMTELNAHQHSNEPMTNRLYRKTPIFVALKLSNKVMHAKMSENDNFPLSCEQLKHAENGIENKPLTVISAGKMRSSAVSRQRWADLQADLVTKSKYGKQIIAERSGHDIMTDQPESVVEAVREMVRFYNA